MIEPGMKQLADDVRTQREHYRYKPEGWHKACAPFTRDGTSFTINSVFLRSATDENGVRSCVGCYWRGGGGFTYDPPPFGALRHALAELGLIERNQSDFRGWDTVLHPFSLNGHQFQPEGQFPAAVNLGVIFDRQATD